MASAVRLSVRPPRGLNPIHRDLISWVRLVGLRIRDARLAANLSIFELARATDLGADQIRLWELGARSVTLTGIYQLARTLKIEPSELLP